MAIVEATVRGAPGDLWYEVGPHRIRARVAAAVHYVGRTVLVGIRAHDIMLGPADADADDVSVPAVVVGVEMQGHRTVAELMAGPAFLRSTAAPVSTRVGDHVDVMIDPARFHLFDPGTGVAVHHPE